MARVDSLEHFLTDVADAIRTAEGSSETIQASDFDTRIEALSGGGSAPTDLPELNNTIVNLATSFYDYLLEIPKTYQTYTDEAITLHTPDINFKNYLIQKRSSGKYRVVWFNFNVIGYQQNSINEAKWTVGKINVTSDDISAIFNPNGTVMVSMANNNYYISSEIDTLNECIQKFINNELTYTYASNTFLGAIADNPYIIPYTNSPVINAPGSTLVGSVALSQRISQNETIVAME